MKKKLMTIIALFGMFLTVAMGAVSAHATVPEPVDTDTVEFQLHKKHYTEGQTPKANTGLEDSTFGGTALKGVTFNVYNVSAEYYELVTGTDAITPEAAIAYLANENEFTLPTATAADPEITDSTGLATFAELPKKTNGQHSVYMFVETMKANFATTGNGQRLVVTLPVYATVKNKETELPVIHLYPKNLINNYSVSLKKVGTDTDEAIDGAKFTLERAKGDGVEYYRSFDGESQEITWSATETRFDGNTTFTGLVPGTYTLREVVAATGYHITTNASETEFTIASDGTMTGMSEEDDNKNGIPLNPVNLDHTATSNQIVVENRKLTSFTFEKYDVATGKALDGATFYVAYDKTSGKHLYEKTATVEPTEYLYEWFTDTEAAGKTDYTKVTLDGYDEKTVSGILPGTYYLYEAVTPEGFVTPADPYTEVNTFEIEDEVITVTAPEDIRIGNVRKGALPSTGGNGIAMFIIVGGVVMAGALIVFRRTRGNQEQV
ncbi:pilin N-terminal domain-containing protein [Enterococcus diestrammenae]|uniref:pilin N-terminal domain-containing protein n=1 Tax=Enterococcus diestrammenae TaxID=1155073 RepID=UPI0022E62A6D|nr:pilin N-terminal domain-containing protein [Enterococcus diestrammenae]